MQEGCIDLEERFSRRYRVGYEESYHTQYGRRARRRDPWLLVVRCRYGHVYPFGGDLLAASLDGHPKVANRLRRLSCCRVRQDGDGGELTAVFDVSDFSEVAKILRPRRRRQLSEHQRKVLAQRILAAGRSTRFTARRTVSHRLHQENIWILSKNYSLRPAGGSGCLKSQGIGSFRAGIWGESV